MQAQASGRDEAGGAEGQGSRQQPQQRRPQEAVGQVQHNQAAVKQKLLERLADDVCIPPSTQSMSHNTHVYMHIQVFDGCMRAWMAAYIAAYLLLQTHVCMYMFAKPWMAMSGCNGWRPVERHQRVELTGT